jgi:hypothetical protein
MIERLSFYICPSGPFPSKVDPSFIWLSPNMQVVIGGTFPSIVSLLQNHEASN